MNMITQKTTDAGTDRRFLDAALRLARKHEGLTGTNPSVACVIVKQTEHGPRIIGSGVTAKGGRPHAEPPALEEAGELARGATAYVTLEPCAHHGKTPPCAQSLIDAGVARVVTAIVDPDNRVNGKGHEMLVAAGVEVTQMDGGEAALRVMRGYLKARTSPQPFITLKVAMTEDGIIGSRKEGNLNISSSTSWAQTHLQRARHSAILVASGTAIADDPSLTCRLPGMEERSPLRIVLDAKSRMTQDHNLVSTANRIPTIVVAPEDAPIEWQEMLARNSVRYQACEIENGRIALPELMDDLAARGIQSILVEGGAAITKDFLEENLVDEIIVHVGGSPQKPDAPEYAVYAPFTPAQLPDGFEVVQTLDLGMDRSLRLQRKAA